MVISARISFGAKCVEISFGFDAKSLSKWGSLKKTPNIGTNNGEENTTVSQRTLKVFLSKWGGPAATTRSEIPRFWGSVEGGDAR